MKIGVTADTHSLPIPPKVLEAFKKVDFIIHAGDFCSTDDLKIFQGLRDVKAVYGNMDDKSLHKKLPETIIIEIEGAKIGVFHGEGSRKTVLESVKNKFAKMKLDVVIFGHSHEPMNERIGSTLYFNPGSPNDTITAPFCSYGILTINKGVVDGKILKI